MNRVEHSRNPVLVTQRHTIAFLSLHHLGSDKEEILQDMKEKDGES